MRKEKWNINLRKVMPKEIRFEYDFDLPLFRALIFLVCYNRRLGNDFHNKPGFGFSGKLRIDITKPRASLLQGLAGMANNDNLPIEPDSYYSKPTLSQKEENAAQKKKKETAKSVNMIGDIIKRRTSTHIEASPEDVETFEPKSP
jgi:hypothetical protein